MGAGTAGKTCRQVSHLDLYHHSYPLLVSFCLFSGLRKGPAERGHVKKRQKSSKSEKVFRHFSTIFVQGKKRSKSSKSVKKFFVHFSTIFARHHFSGPFWGALIYEGCMGGSHSTIKVMILYTMGGNPHQETSHSSDFCNSRLGNAPARHRGLPGDPKRVRKESERVSRPGEPQSPQRVRYGV